MTNIYQRLEKVETSRKSLFLFIFLSLINLAALYFFIKINLNHLLSLELPYYLLFLLLLFLFNFTLTILSIVYDLDRFILLNILMMLIIYFSLNNLILDNYFLMFFLLGLFILFQFNLYHSINKIYKNSINIDWLSIFRISWNIVTFFYLIFLFSFLTFLPSLEKLSFQDIYNSLNKFSNIKWNNQISLDTKIGDILNQNIESNLPLKLKNEVIMKSIKDLNNKFNINISAESTIREAVAQYLVKQIDIIKKNGNKTYFLKASILFMIFILIQPIFYLLGFIIAFISFLLIKILIHLKIFKLTYSQITKEIIDI